MISNKSEASHFMNEIYAAKKIRLAEEHAKVKNFRNVVEGNKMDAGVWKDLNEFS